ncbi:uncharacterized protein [Cicer arietinum]|uniref:uncharacterized protein n=1 Tax=Cicer arietinum TaxID=3827 RepID=UPI003CC543D8
MQPGESILDLQKRFSHLTNHLTALGKIFTNDELNLKVLRSLTRAWQPKVTAISEKKSLSKMSLSALFGKLQEHEIELGRLEQNESQEKKNKNIALKTESREQSKENDSDEDENIILLVKKFGKFLKNDRTFKKKSFKKKDNSTSNQNFTCFECGKQGHIKADCPNIAKKNFNRKKDFKKAYIAWEDNEVSSSSETESEECANVALMASHQSDDEEVSKQKTSNMWYLDSGCSKHMTGDITKFSALTLESKGHVVYGDNNKGKILGIGKVGTAPSPSIEDVLYVEGLKHNLISISQLCDKGYKIVFNKDECVIQNEATNETQFVAQHVEEFIGYNGPVYPNLVRVFYCNLIQEGKLLVSRVKGKVIRLNTKTIGEILNIPFNGEQFCPNNLCEWGDISKYDAYVSLCRFDRRTMEQKRAQAGSKYTQQRYGVGNLTVVNLIGHFLKSVMFGSREAIGLPYAKEMSRILDHFGVDFSDEVMYTPTKENMLDLGVLPSMWIIWNEKLEAFVHKGDHGQPSDDAQEDNAGPSNAAAQGDEDDDTRVHSTDRYLDDGDVVRLP